MVGTRLTRRRFPLDEQLPPPVEHYLAELQDALPVRTAATTDLLAEVADGLLESFEAHLAAGEDRADAAHYAVAEFGPARDLARGVLREMTGTTAHRVGLALVTTGPIVGLAWLTLFAMRSDTRWFQQVPSVLGWLPGDGALMFFVVAPAVLAIISGRGPVISRFPIGPCHAASAAVAAAIGCTAVDTLLLTHLARLAASGALPGVFAVIPVALSLARMLVAVTAARRCLELRAAAYSS